MTTIDYNLNLHHCEKVYRLLSDLENGKFICSLDYITLVKICEYMQVDVYPKRDVMFHGKRDKAIIPKLLELIRSYLLKTKPLVIGKNIKYEQAKQMFADRVDDYLAYKYALHIFYSLRTLTGGEYIHTEIRELFTASTIEAKFNHGNSDEDGMLPYMYWKIYTTENKIDEIAEYLQNKLSEPISKTALSKVLRFQGQDLYAYK